MTSLDMDALAAAMRAASAEKDSDDCRLLTAGGVASGRRPAMTAPVRVAAVPLGGSPCAGCGHPADRMVIYPVKRVVWHVRAGFCELPNPPARQAVQP